MECSRPWVFYNNTCAIPLSWWARTFCIPIRWPKGGSRTLCGTSPAKSWRKSLLLNIFVLHVFILALFGLSACQSSELSLIQERLMICGWCVTLVSLRFADSQVYALVGERVQFPKRHACEALGADNIIAAWNVVCAVPFEDQCSVAGPVAYILAIPRADQRVF